MNTPHAEIIRNIIHEMRTDEVRPYVENLSPEEKAGLFIDFPANPEYSLKDGEKPVLNLLLFAIRYAPEIMTDYFLELGFSPESRTRINSGNSNTRQGDTGTHIYCRNHQNSDTLKKMLQHGFPVDEKNTAGTTPLVFAANREKEWLCDILLDHGADPNKAIQAKHCEKKGKKLIQQLVKERKKQVSSPSHSTSGAEPLSTPPSIENDIPSKPTPPPMPQVKPAKMEQATVWGHHDRAMIELRETLTSGTTCQYLFDMNAREVTTTSTLITATGQELIGTAQTKPFDQFDKDLVTEAETRFRKRNINHKNV